jgi:hypothetical protein
MEAAGISAFVDAHPPKSLIFAVKGEWMTILLIILILLLIGAVPAWPYSRGWGYYPSGGLGLILIIVIVLLLLHVV